MGAGVCGNLFLVHERETVADAARLDFSSVGPVHGRGERHADVPRGGGDGQPSLGPFPNGIKCGEDAGAVGGGYGLVRFEQGDKRGTGCRGGLCGGVLHVAMFIA